MREETEVRVLVTGGAGFIGSHVVDGLLDLGATVLVLDDLSTGQLANLSRRVGDSRLTIVEADAGAPLAKPIAAFETIHGPMTHLVLLAGHTSVAASLSDPWPDLSINLGGTLRALEIARHQSVRQVVYASSAAVYGDGTCSASLELPIREDVPARPLSPYGIHKLASEHYLSVGARTYGVPAVALRLFNVYGPRQSPSSQYCGVVSRFVRSALSGQPIEVHGDGRQTRDFVFVGDVARAIIAATQSPPSLGGVYNVGAGVETSIRTLAEIVRNACGSDSPIIAAPARQGDVHRSCADIANAQSVLGFAPAISLEDGIARTVAWWRTKK